MRVLIVGAGGVGGYLAYKLIGCGVDVAIRARGSHLEMIEQNGLKIIDVDREDIIHPKTNMQGIYDIVFITTKSYHLDSVINDIEPFINENSIIMPILNGIGHFEKFENLNAKLIKACIYILSNIKEDGVIYKKTPLFYLCLEKNESLKEIFKICTDLKVKFSQNIKQDIWKKYLFIATFATLQSYYQKPTGWIMEEKRDEVETFIDEVIKIAKDEGIDLKSEKEKVIKQALNIPYNSKMSMQIDFEKAHKTELDNLTGYLAKKSEFIDGYFKKLKAKI